MNARAFGEQCDYQVRILKHEKTGDIAVQLVFATDGETDAAIITLAPGSAMLMVEQIVTGLADAKGVQLEDLVRRGRN